MPDRRYNAIHLDLKAHEYRLDYLRDVITRFAAAGADCLFLEPEDKLPFLPKLGVPCTPESKALIRGIKNVAAQNGLAVIPQIQSLAHVEFILQQARHASLREVFFSDYQFCPSNARVRDFIRQFIDLTLREFPAASHLSLGGDEPWFGGLTMCPNCAKRAGKVGIPAVFVNHYKPLINHVHRRGIKPMIWGDFVINHPEIIEKLPSQTVIKHWNYNHKTPEQWIREVNRFHAKGLEVWITPASRCAGDSFFLPNIAKHVPNVNSAVEAFFKTQAAGFLNTAWGIRQTPLEMALPLLHAAAQWIHQNGQGNITNHLADYSERYWGACGHDFTDFYLNLCPVWPCFVQCGYFQRNLNGTWSTGLTPEQSFFRFWRGTKGQNKIARLAKKIANATLSSLDKLNRIHPKKEPGRKEKDLWSYGLEMQLLKIQTTLLYVRIQWGEKIGRLELRKLSRTINRLKIRTRQLLKPSFEEDTLNHQVTIRFQEEDNLLATYR